MALPGGVRDQDGSFYFVDGNAYIWTSTERADDVDFGLYRSIYGGMKLLNGDTSPRGSPRRSAAYGIRTEAALPPSVPVIRERSRRRISAMKWGWRVRGCP